MLMRQEIYDALPTAPTHPIPHSTNACPFPSAPLKIVPAWTLFQSQLRCATLAVAQMLRLRLC